MPTAANSPQKLQTHSFKTAVISSILHHATDSSTVACKHLENDSCNNYLSIKWLHETIHHLQFTSNQSCNKCQNCYSCINMQGVFKQTSAEANSTSNDSFKSQHHLEVSAKKLQKTT